VTDPWDNTPHDREVDAFYASSTPRQPLHPPAPKLTSLQFTLEELTLLGDLMDAECTGKHRDVPQSGEMWVRVNSLRTMFREAQYGVRG
jgi:hypothetical protein